MTQPRELDHILTAFFVAGTDELADRVIDAALDHIDHTPQRHATRLPRRFPTMTLYTRLAVAAVIGVIAVGGALYLTRPTTPDVGVPTRTAGASLHPSEPTPSPTPLAELTGSLGVGRQIQTATTLADGRVLISGGYALGDGALGSAVVYDPATGAFGPTGSLADARGYHTATLLADGRVLITGGGTANWDSLVPQADRRFLASAELYDPATGRFTPTGSMATPREVHTATLLDNGRVLIVGGMKTSGESVASTELYDPTTGTFSPTGSMKNARAFHTATLLADGRVLIVGGSPAAWTNGTTLDAAEIYDPATGTFTTTGTLARGRSFHSATLLPDGRVLVAGGYGQEVWNLPSTEIWDPSTGTFSAGAAMVAGREYHTVTTLADGRILFAGGGYDYANRLFLASAELYDPATGSFSATGSMADARTYHAANLLADGRVLVTGGFGLIAPLPSAETYDPATGAFSPAGSGG